MPRASLNAPEDLLKKSRRQLSKALQALPRPVCVPELILPRQNQN